MRKLFLGLMVLCFSFLLAHAAHAQDTFQLFGGYSFLRPPVTLVAGPFPLDCPGTCPPAPIIDYSSHSNLNGWELSGTYNANKWLGVTADFSGHYGSDQGFGVHVQTYLAGPQIRLPGRVSPFAHALLGAAHESIGENPILGVSGGSDTAFAVAVGGGIDIKMARFVSIRAIQADYLLTRLGSTTQNQVRVSAGLVFHS